MKRWGMSALLALGLAGGAAAHRLDEYLQATLIGVTRGGIELEIQLTPGVAVLPVLMAAIDQDGDGRISAEEERAYAGRVLREVELRVNGARAPLRLMESSFPTVEAMREGLGTIRIKLRAAGGGQEVRFENRHMPQISVYLVNCLTTEGLVVKRQARDEAQRSLAFEYSFGEPRMLVWSAALGMLLMVRMTVLIYKAKTRQVGCATRMERLQLRRKYVRPGSF